jgi:hypothetical protein
MSPRECRPDGRGIIAGGVFRDTAAEGDAARTARCRGRVRAGSRFKLTAPSSCPVNLRCRAGATQPRGPFQRRIVPAHSGMRVVMDIGGGAGADSAAALSD